MSEASEARLYVGSVGSAFVCRKRVCMSEARLYVGNNLYQDFEANVNPATIGHELRDGAILLRFARSRGAHGKNLALRHRPECERALYP